MHRYCSPFQGADTTGAPVSQHTAHGIRQFGFRTENEELQSPSNFAPLAKPYDHIRVPPQTPPSTCSPSFADTLSHEQPPSRGASPSPASLFSHQSSASSSYTHFSSSGVSLEVGSERESSGPCPPFHQPNFRPTSPSARIASPYNRPPSRIITRPGSPLVRQAWMHSAAVARPASRRSHRPGSQSIDHSIHQATRQMNLGNAPHAGEKEPDLAHQFTSHRDGREQVMSGGNGANETVSAPTFSAVLEQLEDAPQLRSERPAHNSAPSPDTSSNQDASTMMGLSDSDEPSPRSPDSDETTPEQPIRVLRTILVDEFDLHLGTCDPPEDMVSAVADCLDRIAISRRQCRLHGYLVPINSVHNPNDSNAPEPTRSPPEDTNPGGKRAGGLKKRGMSDMGRDDQDDTHEDEDDDDDDAGGAGIDPNPVGDRKRAKLEAYACPFRKRNPIKFNIREWEYCAKAPFKSIPELKKHLNKYHKQFALAYKCERCHMSFSSRENLKDHLRKDPSQMCELSSDREGSPTSSIEAVSSTVGDRFRSRNEHFDWKGIWQALFPGDHPHEIPSPGEPPTFAAPWPRTVAIDGLVANWTAPQDFEPPVEIHEVIQQFKDSLPALSNELLTAFGPGNDIALGIIKGFAEGVFQRARTQSLAGTRGSTSPLSTNRHTQLPPSNSPAPPIFGTNPGTPSSTTTSSWGSRQRWSRNGGLSTAHTSGASTPASQLRDSPSLGRQSMSPRGHAWSNSSRCNFYGQQLLQSGFPPPTVSPLSNHSGAASVTGPVPVFLSIVGSSMPSFTSMASICCDF